MLSPSGQFEPNVIERLRISAGTSSTIRIHGIQRLKTFEPSSATRERKDEPGQTPNRLTTATVICFYVLLDRAGPRRPCSRPISFEPDSRQNGSMELERATRDLYRTAPAEFTAARDVMAAEARQAGDSELASSLKKLRKPSVGAWLANLLVLEQASDVKRLIELGAQLRAPERKLEGAQIRRVSKEKGEVVSQLMRDAQSKASEAGQSVSATAAQELEATLEAAFADPQAAQTLLGGCLTSGLHYSGLGFGELAASGSPTGTKGPASPHGARSEADRVAAEQSLEKACHEAELADADVEKARQALARAAEELTRLKSSEALAVRRSKAAHAKVSAAMKNLSKGR